MEPVVPDPVEHDDDRLRKLELSCLVSRVVRIGNGHFGQYGTFYSDYNAAENSSRKSTPPWANEISPGRGGFPPPRSAAGVIEEWGARNGRRRRGRGHGGSISCLF